MSNNKQVFFLEGPDFNLSCCLFRNAQKPSDTLTILSHGFAYCSSMFEHARLFVETAEEITKKTSSDALIFDFEGHGLSSGSFKDTSPLQRIRNLNFVIDWARGQYKQVVLLGFSMGAAASIYSALEKDVDGLITWNSVPTMSLTAPSSTWFFHEPDGNESEHHGKSWITDRPKTDIKDVYPKITCPKLHIQATADYPGFEVEFTPIFDSANGSKKKVMVKDANHAFTREDHRAELYAATCAWINDFGAGKLA